MIQALLIIIMTAGCMSRSRLFAESNEVAIRAPAGQSETRGPIDVPQTDTTADPIGSLISSIEWDSCTDPKFAYPACSKESLFFESQLNRRPRLADRCPISSKHSLSADEVFLKSSLSPACSFAVLDIYKNASPSILGECPNVPKRPACVTPSMHVAIHNAIVSTSRCLDINPLQVFSKFSAESKLQLNAQSASMSTGIGQITNGWATDVRDRWAVFENLVTSNDPRCRDIQSRSLQALRRTQPFDRCVLMGPPDNPLLSVFLGGIHFAYARAEIAPLLVPALNLPPTQTEKDALSQIDELLTETQTLQKERSRLRLEAKGTSAKRLRGIREELKAIQSKLKAHQVNRQKLLKAIDQSRLEAVNRSAAATKALVELSLYAYNTGHGGLKDVFRQFSRSKFARDLESSSIEGPDGRFIQFLKSLPLGHRLFQVRGRSPATRKQEILNYVHSTGRGAGRHSAIANEIERVNRKVQESGLVPEGVKCSEF